MIDLDVYYLKQRFEYDAESGVLYWKKASKRWIGKQAGALHTANRGKKYFRCTLDGDSIYCHRIIWAIVYGESPDNIDHIDGDGLNNKLSNLRRVQHSVNLKNQKMHSTNTSGHTGVCLRKDSGRWRARIEVDGKPISLGTFSNFDLALSARKQAEKQYGFIAQ